MGCRSIRSSVYRRDISNSLSLEISKFIYSSWREQLSRSPRLYNKRRRWKKIVKIVLNARISAFLFLDKEKDTYIFHVCKIYKKKKKKERKTRNHRFSPRFSPRHDFTISFPIEFQLWNLNLISSSTRIYEWNFMARDITLSRFI